MTGQSFSLIAFPDPDFPDISITGKIHRQNNLLTIQYVLTGEVINISLPLPSVKPARKGNLWKATCFELFFAVKDLPQYWECNISPTGDWNVYRMDAYRRIGFRDETAIKRLQVWTQKTKNGLILDAAMDLNPIIRLGQVLEVGVTAVIQTREGNESYWALAHPAPEPDFHLRESFILQTAERIHL
jgi:hypothetical protein